MKIDDINNDDKRRDTFVSLVCRLENELRGFLDKYSQDLVGSYTYTPNVNKARDHYIYNALNEVEKAMMYCMRTSELLSDEDGKNAHVEPKDNISINIVESIKDEFYFWERKLSELLIAMVNFRGSNEDGYYRHYIVLKELKKLFSVQNDYKDFYGIKNRNIDYQIEELKQRADTIISKLDIKKIWYVKSISSKGKAKYQIASHKAMLDKAFSRMTAAEKVTVGKTYLQYVIQSSSIHAGQINQNSKHTSISNIDAFHFMRLCMLGLYVTLNAQKCLRINNTRSNLAKWQSLIKSNTYPNEIFEKEIKTSIEQGDFVIVNGSLAEVQKVITSDYGYKSFRIKYIEKAPIEGVDDIDELPALYVKLLQKRQEIKRQVIEKITQDQIKQKLSHKKLNDAVRKTIHDYWCKMGGKELAFGDKDKAYNKLCRFHDELKTKI